VGWPIIASSTSTATGSTRVTLRNRLADELGFLHITTVSTTATQGDTARIVLADELRDDEIGYELFDEPWVYVRNGDQAGIQRRVISQPGVGYQGTGGTLIVSRPYAAALASGTVIEVTAPLPVDRAGVVKGLHQCINEGLRMTRVEGRISFTGNGGYAYDLDSYPWLVHEGQTAGIYDASYLIVDEPLLSNPSSTYSIASNGVARQLVTTRSYAADETFELAVLVPGDMLVFDGSSWTYPTIPGLLDDTYQAAAPDHWVIAFAMVKALEFLQRAIRMKRMDPAEKTPLLADLSARMRKWVLTARRIKRYEFPRVALPRSEPMVAGTSGWSWTERW
jgi:hypothetical protein